MKKIEALEINKNNVKMFLDRVDPMELFEHKFIYYVMADNTVRDYYYKYDERFNYPGCEIVKIETQQILKFGLNFIYNEFNINSNLFDKLSIQQSCSFDTVSCILSEILDIFTTREIKAIATSNTKITLDDLQNTIDILSVMHNLLIDGVKTKNLIK